MAMVLALYRIPITCFNTLDDQDSSIGKCRKIFFIGFMDFSYFLDEKFLALTLQLIDEKIEEKVFKAFS